MTLALLACSHPLLSLSLSLSLAYVAINQWQYCVLVSVLHTWYAGSAQSGWGYIIVGPWLSEPCKSTS